LQSSTSRVCLYLDLHAHSKHKGIFAFGCVTGDEKEEIFSITSSRRRERHISPTQLRMKVVRSNSTSSSTSSSSSLQKNRVGESNETQGGDPTQGIAMALKERSRSAGPQGRIGSRIPTPPVDQQQVIKNSSRLLDTDSVLSTSSRNASPARSLELKYERVKSAPSLSSLFLLLTSLPTESFPRFSIKISKPSLIAFAGLLSSLPPLAHSLVATVSLQINSPHLVLSWLWRSVTSLSSPPPPLSRKAGVEHSYTIEASMAGSHDDLFQPSDYMQIGSELGSRS
jgi:hypothetical protein